MAWFLVGMGGIVGALLRYQVSRFMNARFEMKFPYPTLFVNLTGAFLLGWFTSSLHRYFPHLGSAPMLVLGVGVCGAYTTFSTFSYEVMALVREERGFTALSYVLVSGLGGFALSGIGLFGLPR